MSSVSRTMRRRIDAYRPKPEPRSLRLAGPKPRRRTPADTPAPLRTRQERAVILDEARALLPARGVVRHDDATLVALLAETAHEAGTSRRDVLRELRRRGVRVGKPAHPRRDRVAVRAAEEATR